MIGDSIFYECKNLKSVKFPNSLKKIGLFAFFGCGLEDVEFPASVRTVCQGAFAECENLKSARFHDGLEILGSNERPSEKANFDYY